MMLKKWSLCIAFFLVFLVATQSGVPAQENPDIHVVVNMVQLNVAVTDKKGNYVTGLKPSDFEIVEDGILEQPATFGEGNEPVRNLGDISAPNRPSADEHLGTPSFRDLISGANVFVLFDTSDYMYRGFVFAQDAITEFI